MNNDPASLTDPNGLLAKTDLRRAGGNLYNDAILLTVLDVVQTGLDVVGLVPGLGEITDGVNALIYVARGDYTNIALSTAAMIPIAGWGATGAK